ncbi:MAG: hypothetical protein RLZZ192_631 [Pseudomonadota bacterium]
MLLILGAAHRRGNCWDNAVAESFFSSLKRERIRKRIYKTREMACADIFDYIEVFYNLSRRHSHLGGISPEAFETAAAWGQVLSSRPGIVQFQWIRVNSSCNSRTLTIDKIAGNVSLLYLRASVHKDLRWSSSTFPSGGSSQ